MIVSYDIGLKGGPRCFWQTVELHRKFVKLLIGVVMAEKRNFPELSGHRLMSAIESLIHSTKDRKARYGCFDRQFPKYPTYLRRADINEAIGIVDSYLAGIEEWKENGCVSQKPHLHINRKSMPYLYRYNMFMLESAGDSYYCRIKLFNDGRWQWNRFEFVPSDLKYVMKNFDIESLICPRLKKGTKKFSIAVSFRVEAPQPERTGRIVSCDLGLNSYAVCAVMDRNGAVLSRKFFDYPVEKDRMHHIRNQVRRAHSEAPCHSKKLNRWARFYNEALAIKTAHDVVVYAEENHADVIVMEWLRADFGKLKGAGKHDIANWNKKEIARRVQELAERKGIGFQDVHASRTSLLAFDGSGTVSRDRKNYSLCRFRTGKRYNADLNAAYNIGARYLIRQLRKRFVEVYGKDRNRLSEIVPELLPETRCTLSTFYDLVRVLHKYPEVARSFPYLMQKDA